MVLPSSGPQQALKLETRAGRMGTGMPKDQRPEENKAGSVGARKKGHSGKMVPM